MCIRIGVVDTATRAVVWDPLEIRLLVREGTAPSLALAQVAAVLGDLGARRTWSGFRCFCGEPVLLPPELAVHADTG